MGRAVSELRFVTQSENRSRVLEILSADSPLKRQDVESRLDSSHRTVIRVVNSLEERGYLYETDRGLHLTPFGSYIADELDDSLTTAELALEFKPLLSNAPPVFREIPIHSLKGAELLVASDADPFSILDRVLSLRADATRIREVAPAIQKESIDQLAERVRRDEGVDVEAVISQRASDIAESRSDYRDGHLTTIESDAVDLYVHPERISFFAGLMDDTAAIAVSKDEQPFALAISDDPDLRTAVRSVFERYRDEATLKASN